MKNYLLNFGAVLLGSAMTFSSCVKEQTAGGQLSYKVKPSNLTASVGATISGSGLVVEANSNSSLTWTSGNLNVKEINFEARKNDVRIKYELKDQFRFNILETSPVFGKITMPDGAYDQVALKLKLEKSTGDNIPLYLRGTYTNSTGRTTPVVFYFNEDFEVEVKAENLQGGGSAYLGLINLKLNKFLTNISSGQLDEAVITNETIVIAATSNVYLYDKLRANLNVFGDCEFDN